MLRIKSVKVVSTPESIMKIAINLAKHSSDTIIASLKAEIATLKTSLHKAGELIEEDKIVNKIQLVTNEALNKQNKLFRAQLRKFGQVFDNCGGKEVDAEFDEEEFNNNKKGESDHE